MIRAPYNFVPLASKVYFPDWASYVSQDIPFRDGEDGIIEFELNNETPLFVRNGHGKAADDDSFYSAHIKDAQGNRHYFIPSTTLKGCFRNILEVLSFAKFNRFNKAAFGYRIFDTKQTDGAAYVEAMKNVKCGWLQCKGGDKYVIRPCKEPITTIAHSELKETFPSFYKGKDHETAEGKQKSLDDNEFYPLYEKNGKQYRVVCTGFMNAKQHEYLFSEELSAEIDVPFDVFESFNAVHDSTPYYAGLNGKNGFLKNRLESGKSIPVFYIYDKSKIQCMGITRMFKYPFLTDVNTAVKNTCADYSSEKLDLVDVMYGYVNGVQSLKGRVAFANSFIADDKIILDKECSVVSGVLGQPKASYYPLYLDQDGFVFKTYDNEGVKVAGRKQYRIIKDNVTLSLPQGNDNENVKISFKPIPAGNVFKCKVVFHNLRKVEIGALISSITMNETPDTFFNVGLAKAYGYGKIKCTINQDSFKHLNYTELEYLQAFEAEISNFLQLECDSTFESNRSLQTLVSITSATHTADEMHLMDLDEYEECKRNNNFSKLKEKPKKIAVHIQESEIIEKYVYNKAVELMEIGELNKAEYMLSKGIERIRSIGAPVEKLQLLFDDCRDKISKANAAKAAEERLVTIKNEVADMLTIVDGFANAASFADAINKCNDIIALCQSNGLPFDYVEVKRQSIIEQREQANQSKAQAGLSTLNEKAANGNFKVNDFKGAKNRIDQWIKKSNGGNVMLPDSQCGYVVECLSRVKSLAKNKKDLQEWADENSKTWCYIKGILTEEWYSKLK